MTQEADPKLDELRKAVDRACNTYGLTYPRGGATLRVDAFEALEAYIAGRERERWGEGVSRIADERRRQIDAEGYTPLHDSEHEDGDIACAAAVYAAPDWARTEGVMDLLWPGAWAFKPTPTDRIRELVKAGALIAAEIDRLRALLQLEQGGQ